MPSPLSIIPPFCQVASFAAFAFSGAIDFDTLPTCTDTPYHALKTERPIPFFLCKHHLHTFVHSLSRIGFIPPTCAGCKDSPPSCSPPSDTPLPNFNPNIPSPEQPQWNEPPPSEDDLGITPDPDDEP